MKAVFWPLFAKRSIHATFFSLSYPLPTRSSAKSCQSGFTGASVINILIIISVLRKKIIALNLPNYETVFFTLYSYLHSMQRPFCSGGYRLVAWAGECRRGFLLHVPFWNGSHTEEIESLRRPNSRVNERRSFFARDVPFSSEVFFLSSRSDLFLLLLLLFIVFVSAKVSFKPH